MPEGKALSKVYRPIITEGITKAITEEGETKVVEVYYLNLIDEKLYSLWERCSKGKAEENDFALHQSLREDSEKELGPSHPMLVKIREVVFKMVSSGNLTNIIVKPAVGPNQDDQPSQNKTVMQGPAPDNKPPPTTPNKKPPCTENEDEHK